MATRRPVGHLQRPFERLPVAAAVAGERRILARGPVLRLATDRRGAEGVEESAGRPYSWGKPLEFSSLKVHDKAF